jgi:lipoprotein-anchoring transpeptidase ErfK/SrfK
VVALLPEGPLRAEVEARHLRRVLRSPPPADLAPGERWIDVSLGEQVATAYEGAAPVFAALVSTAPHGGTPAGSYAVYRKYRRQTMANIAGARAQYDFRQVPHAQFFHGRFGLHAALWHDLLGHPVSHGCVNLSPADAERLFAFTAPALPPGWHALTTDSGTRIVVRR